MTRSPADQQKTRRDTRREAPRTGPRAAPADGWREFRAEPRELRLPTTAFGRLGTVHGVMAAGDALVTLALAGSLFFSISPDAAKSKVLLYLVLSLAPFVVVSPFIGPLIDRIQGGQHWVLFVSAAVRTVLCLFMAGHVDSLLLFPEAFAALVAAKAYAVARSSLVPAVVRNDGELVQANSRLSLIAGLGGVIALVPGGVLARFGGSDWVLRLAAVVFVGAAAMALRVKTLPHRAVGASAASEGDDAAVGVEDHVERALAARRRAVVRVNAFAVGMLRAVVGFLTFLVLFSFRRAAAPLWWSGAVGASAGLGIQVGALLAMRLRRNVAEERMIIGALGGVALVAGGACLAASRPAAALVAGVVGLAGSVGRLAFDAIVQRDGIESERGAAFARYETRFQLAWVIGALAPVAISIPRSVGFALIALAMAAAIAVEVIGEPALEWIEARIFGLKEQWSKPARRARNAPWSSDDF